MRTFKTIDSPTTSPSVIPPSSPVLRHPPKQPYWESDCRQKPTPTIPKDTAKGHSTLLLIFPLFPQLSSHPCSQGKKHYRPSLLSYFTLSISNHHNSTPQVMVRCCWHLFSNEFIFQMLGKCFSRNSAQPRYNHFLHKTKPMSNKGEFIYSTHLWGGLGGLNKQSSGSQAPKLASRVSQKPRKISEHTWDHEEPLLKARKFSEDDGFSANFNPFESLI